jgi:uncharacterized protein YjbI with pentapeptide repeats
MNYFNYFLNFTFLILFLNSFTFSLTPPVFQQSKKMSREEQLQHFEKTGQGMYADFKNIDLRPAIATLNQKGKDINLYNANLEGANLQGADLSGALLSCADLSGACLDQALLKNAILTFTRLNGASLYQAHLENAHCSRTDFSQANLEEAFFEGADIKGARFFKAKVHYTLLSPVTRFLKYMFAMATPFS